MGMRRIKIVSTEGDSLCRGWEISSRGGVLSSSAKGSLCGVGVGDAGRASSSALHLAPWQLRALSSAGSGRARGRVLCSA